MKLIPTPQEEVQPVEEIQEQPVVEEKQAKKAKQEKEEKEKYEQETTFEVKPSLWQRIKQSKFGRAITYLFKTRVVLEVPALPEAKHE